MKDLAEGKTNIKPIFLIIKASMKYKRVSTNENLILIFIEAVVQRCSVKKILLEISHYSQENICARVSFLINKKISLE